MKYKVLETHPDGSNTAVTIRGDGADLSPGCEITDENNVHYTILDIQKDPSNFIDHVEPSRILIIQGAFYSRKVVSDATEISSRRHLGGGAISAFINQNSPDKSL